MNTTANRSNPASVTTANHTSAKSCACGPACKCGPSCKCQPGATCTPACKCGG